MKKILIIDDSKIDQTLIGHIISKSFGYIFKTADNGKEGLNILMQESFDLILLDVSMPEMDGITLLQKIKNQGLNPNAKIIMMSAMTDRSIITKALSLGILDYCPKPLNINSIFGKLNQALAA